MAITTRGKTLYIDFSCYLPTGRRVRCKESTRLVDNPVNRKAIQGKYQAIKYELTSGQFDYLRHFPCGSKAKYFSSRKTSFTLSDFWDQVLMEKSIRPNSLKSIAQAWFHIKPHFGDFAISNIDESHIKIFRNELIAKGFKNSTINLYIRHFNSILRTANHRGLIDVNPFEHLGSLKESRVEIEPLSFDELETLLNYLQANKPEYYDWLFIWSRTGLRPGEFCALRWAESIDYLNGQILVKKTMHPYGEGPVKTEYSYRAIKMATGVAEALKRQEARSRLIGPYVFLLNGKPIRMRLYLIQLFKRLFSLAGVKYRAPKQLRHTFATLHIAAGENISWVAQVLGHSNVEITLRRYNRYIPDLTRNDGSAFDKIVGGKS